MRGVSLGAVTGKTGLVELREKRVTMKEKRARWAQGGWIVTPETCTNALCLGKKVRNGRKMHQAE